MSDKIVSDVAATILADVEQKLLAEVHKLEADFHAALDQFGASRELSLAKTKVQEAVMWVKQHLGV